MEYLLSDSGYKNGLVACLDCDKGNTTTPIYMTFDRERHLDFSKYVKGTINNSKLKFYITHMSDEGLMYYGKQIGKHNKKHL